MSSQTKSFIDEHEAFAASRVSQYVYVPTRDHFFQTLDQHADTLEGDVKPPLVLVGNEGSGKSALLANWVAKRREHRHRDEFLFQHFVGCTMPSMQLAHTLFRLETALKDFYQLREMKVPESEEELRWSLNRFLAAAAKKHSPARIIIIIDGINKLKAEGVPDGALHWLPTELPPCVRFLVSSVEFERIPSKDMGDLPQHRTFVELARRQCPLLRIEPLSVPTRHSVIQSFVSLSAEGKDVLELNDSQQFKIVTAPATSQPMYLRSLLQALRATATLTKIPMDQLLETFLSCNTAHELIDKQLNICCEDITGGVPTGGVKYADILGKMFSMVYISRNGLKYDEIWDMVKMFSVQNPPDESMKEKLFSILFSFTMVVKENHSFSHEIYREVVYSKNICTQEHLIRWHYLMAKYFGQLPPCDRKLEVLPYHLEMAGSWSKVKNCLTDIEMFDLWWTPKFKSDFIKFWASLTRQTPTVKEEYGASHNDRKKKDSKKHGHTHGHTHGHDDNHDANAAGTTGVQLAPRPTYDIVEEYVKSLDEYRTLKHPKPPQVADIVLRIADFLMEFAICGHETMADVPNLIHPPIPQEDLRALGVPHLHTDEDGKTSFSYPSIFKGTFGNIDDGGGAAEAPPRAINDVEVKVTTYFFSRWMWIHYSFVALGNCGKKRYLDGISKMNESSAYESLKPGSKGKKVLEDGKLQKSMDSKTTAFDMTKFKLPEIKFARKASRSVRKITADDANDANVDKLTMRLDALHDDILNFKEEFDFISNMRKTLKNREKACASELEQLKRTAEGMSMNDSAHDAINNRCNHAAKELEEERMLHRNLTALYTMCVRHPANVPALIAEIDAKLEQDIYLINEIRSRLWEQKFEKQSHNENFKHLKALIQEGADMHNRLLEYRYAWKKSLAQQQLDDQRKLDARNTQDTNPSAAKSNRKRSVLGTPHPMLGLAGDGRGNHPAANLALVRQDGSGGTMNWDQAWDVISSRTGIIEPDIFFQRLNNGGVLEKQIDTLKKASEQRLEALKKEVVVVEQDMEESRNLATFAAGPSNKDKIMELSEKQFALRHVKEKSEAAQELVQRIESGLSHIGDLLGVEKREEDQTSSVGDLLRDIETALDTVLDEREKQLQQQAGQQGQNSTAGAPALVAIPGTESLRSPFSRAQTSQYEGNRGHLDMGFDVSKSFAKPRGGKKRQKSSDQAQKSKTSSPRDSDEDEQDEPMDRAYLKTASLKSLKDAEKRAAKAEKEKRDKETAAMK